MENVLLWGTGRVAHMILKECRTLNCYNILGVVDNDDKKIGTLFFGFAVYSPGIIIEKRSIIDRIVILTRSYDEIKRQIVEIDPTLENQIENENYFYKRSILKRYFCSKDPEITDITNYLRAHSLDVFNYDFVDNYEAREDMICYDNDCGLYYRVVKGFNVYLSRKYNSRERAAHYFSRLLMEQDEKSPHKYLDDDFFVNKGDIVIDVGVAEGNFSIEVIESAKKVYMIEADPLWIEALNHTFNDYRDKICIIQKYASSYDEGDFARIDSIINEDVNFIKLDIEGYEYDALKGAFDILNRSAPLKVAACCYHSDFDEVLIRSELDKHGISCTTTKGYMWFPYTFRQTWVSTQLNRGVVRGVKKE